MSASTSSSSSSSHHPKTVAVLGQGIIGSRVADAIEAKGFAIRRWNRSPKPEAPFVTQDLAAAVTGADVVQIFVTTDQALGQVVAQLEPLLTLGQIVINSSTVSLEATRDMAGRLAARGVAFLDAPFTGSKNAAAAAQLSFYIGGDLSLLERVRPVLEASGKAILHTGDIGTATVLKLATNMISATTVGILVEAMALTRSQGIDLAVFAQAMELNACGSGLTRMKIPSVIAGDYAPHFSTKNMLKDARYALALGDAAGLFLPVQALSVKRLAMVEESGAGEEDYSALAKLVLA
jgi:3-hydroxyisobutyrate dehydrogenase-like beta-hydroxyacid dehydrogenase